MPFQITLLNRTPEAPQRAPTPPFNEDFAAFRHANDIRRAKGSCPNIESIRANHPVAAETGRRRCLSIGIQRKHAAERNSNREHSNQWRPHYVVPPLLKRPAKRPLSIHPFHRNRGRLTATDAKSCDAFRF